MDVDDGSVGSPGPSAGVDAGRSATRRRIWMPRGRDRDWKGVGMTSHVRDSSRAHGREAALTFRMSSQEKALLSEQAREAGFRSSQAYLEFLVWGRRPMPRKPGPSEQKELPLTG